MDSWDVELPHVVQDDTSLIRSGLIDSVALFHLVTWIEQQVGHPVDPTQFDLAQEWDTVGDIINFVHKQRGSQSSSGI